MRKTGVSLSHRRWVAGLLLCVLSGPAWGEPPLPSGGSSAPASQEQASTQPADQIDKWKFTLFNPTPKQAMREFNTDRPDVTESPYTVDAGHFQYETSLVSYTHNNHQGERTDLLQALAVSNIKVGLLNNMDLQLVLEPYDNLYSRTKDSAARVQGGGPMQLTTQDQPGRQ